MFTYAMVKKVYQAFNWLNTFYIWRVTARLPRTETFWETCLYPTFPKLSYINVIIILLDCMYCYYLQKKTSDLPKYYVIPSYLAQSILCTDILLVLLIIVAI